MSNMIIEAHVNKENTEVKEKQPQEAPKPKVVEAETAINMMEGTESPQSEKEFWKRKWTLKKVKITRI